MERDFFRLSNQGRPSVNQTNMRIPNTQNSNQGSFDSTMTPMIDVVFLLLIFFVWTASFQLVEYLLPSSLSLGAGKNATELKIPPDFDKVVVRIAMQGNVPTWTINDTPIDSFGQVRQTLVDVASIKNDVPLVIDPDSEVPLGDVIDVYDLARVAGFEKLRFAAKG